MNSQLEADLRNAEATVAALRAELVRLEAQLKHARTPIWPDPWEPDPWEPDPSDSDQEIP